MDHRFESSRPIAPANLEFSDAAWKYEMRRQCQEILPHLYLGPTEAAKSLETLQFLKITGILIIRGQQEERFLKARFEGQFEYFAINLEDRDDQNLIRMTYPPAREFILRHRDNGGKVLLHDDRGISRAPAIAVMHVMDLEGKSYEDAMGFVQSKRYCMHLNNGFMNQCKEFESFLLATKASQQYQAAMATQNGGMSVDPSARPQKRELSPDDDDEMDVVRRSIVPSAVTALR